MTTTKLPNRRAASGAVVVRASSLALGIAAALGLQFAGEREPAPVVMAASPLADCGADAGSGFTAL